MKQIKLFRKTIAFGYLLIVLLLGWIGHIWLNEWRGIEKLENENYQIDIFRKEVNDIHVRLIKFTLLGETILEWNIDDLNNYHSQRMTIDSVLCRFKISFPIERIDSVRHILEEKERQMCQIVRILDEQQHVNKKLAAGTSAIIQKNIQERQPKPRRKGFLGIFGKKEKTDPITTTTFFSSKPRYSTRV